MPPVAYTGLETSSALLAAYASLSLEFKRGRDSEKLMANTMDRDARELPNYGLTLALLALNAAIMEGWLRSVLVQQIHDVIGQLEAENGKNPGFTGPSLRLHKQLHRDAEMNGGWDKLKEQYTLFHDQPLKAIIGDDAYTSMDVLYALRNVIAHGTTIVVPDAKMEDADKDVYPYAWQGKLQQASVYIENLAKRGEFYKNVGDFQLPGHFFEQTKKMLTAVEAHFKKLPDRPKYIADKIRGYSFGYRL